MEAARVQWKTVDDVEGDKRKPMLEDSFIITLEKQRIRTFKLQYEFKCASSEFTQ